MHGELVDEQRVHLALLEVARVDPVVRAGHLVAALGVRDDVAVDLEQQLLDAFFFEHLFEPLRERGRWYSTVSALTSRKLILRKSQTLPMSLRVM